MADSVFTRMLKGEIPRELIYEDDVCFVIPTIRPHTPGHCLVITKEQVENWEDLDEKTYLHTMLVVKKIGKVLKTVYACPKVGISTVGFEVPHVHIHLIPLYKIRDTDHSRAQEAPAEEIAVQAKRIRATLEEKSH